MAHQLMADGALPEGNVAVLVGAPPGETGRGRTSRRRAQGSCTSSMSTPPISFGWTNAIRVSREPPPRHLVHETHSLAPEADERRRDVVHAIGHVMHARAARREEPAHRRVVAQRSEQLDEGRPAGKRTSSTP